jgi:hypothetical protein
MQGQMWRSKALPGLVSSLRDLRLSMGDIFVKKKDDDKRDWRRKTVTLALIILCSGVFCLALYFLNYIFYWL